jgi:indoleamine 2,3-dioxygenase
MAIYIPKLNEFGLSQTRGFLSNDAPLVKFCDGYYREWDELLEKLPDLISSHKLGDEIKSLPILSTSKLSSELDFRRAYVVLAFLVHGYVWGGSQDGKPIETIPPQLSEPFLAVCENLGMQPVLSYAGLCIWNWAVKEDAKSNPEDTFYELEHLKSLGSFTGTRGEDAFYHIPVLVEAEGGPLVSLLLKAIAAAQKEDITFVTNVLNQCAKSFIRMGLHLSKMYSTLDAHMFFHELRPFLSGGNAMPEKEGSSGIVFKKSDGSQKVTKCIGGSAAQSSFFQFLDYVLGVQHQKPGKGQESVFEVSLMDLVCSTHPFD